MSSVVRRAGVATTGQATDAHNPPTFALCVESGVFESMAVRAVESLREFGGRLSDAPVLAITPRAGPPLARETRRRFSELGVRHVWRPHLHRGWFPWMGKVWTALEAERLATTESVAYIDCDLLFLDEPLEFFLPQGVGIVAGYPDDGVVATTGPGSRYETAWERACDAVGLSVDELPWVDLGDGSGRVRFYLNAGIFVFRRASGVPQRWLECTEALFRRRADYGVWREQFHEQVSLGFAIVRFDFPFKPLSYSHNYGIDSSIPHALDSPELASARVLHYHDQLSPTYWEPTLDRLRQLHPHVADWLEPRGPIEDPSTTLARGARRALQRFRLLTRRAYRLPGWVQRKRGRAYLLGGFDDP